MFVRNFSMFRGHRPSMRFRNYHLERKRIPTQGPSLFRKLLGPSLFTLGVSSFVALSYIRASDVQVAKKDNIFQNRGSEKIGNEISENGDSESIGNEISENGDSESIGNEISENGDSESIGNEISENKDSENTGNAISEKRDSDQVVEHFDFVIFADDTYSSVAINELNNNGKSSILLVSENLQITPPNLESKETSVDIAENTDSSDLVNIHSSYPDNVKIISFMEVTGTNTHSKLLRLNDKLFVSYGKCLIATGSHLETLNIPLPEDKTHIMNFTKEEDFQKLDPVLQDPDVKHITVIGGDLLGGQDLTTLLAQKCQGTNKKFVRILPDKFIMEQYFPSSLAEYVTKQIVKENDKVEIIMETKPTEIVQNPEKIPTFTIKLDNGQEIITNHIIVVLTRETSPKTEITKLFNFEIDPIHDGIVATPDLQVESDIWVAGEVASHWDSVFGRKRIHPQNAIKSVQVAALNMLGKKKKFFSLPIYNGKLSNNEYTALGIIDPHLDNVGVWLKGPFPLEATGSLPSTTPSTDLEGSEKAIPNHYEQNKIFQNGIVYYMRDRKLVGILFWNIFGKQMEGMHLIQLPHLYDNYADLQRCIPFEEEDDLDD